LALNFSEHFTQFHYKELAVFYRQSAVATNWTNPSRLLTFLSNDVYSAVNSVQWLLFGQRPIPFSRT